MMRHVLDCLGALKFRLEEGITDGESLSCKYLLKVYENNLIGRADSAIVTHSLVSVFSQAVKSIAGSDFYLNLFTDV